MKLHGRSTVFLPPAAFVRPTERRALLISVSWSFRRYSPPRRLLFARPRAPVRKVYPFFLHIFAETIKIFLQKRIVYVKILLDFFV